MRGLTLLGAGGPQEAVLAEREEQLFPHTRAPLPVGSRKGWWVSAEVLSYIPSVSPPLLLSNDELPLHATFSRIIPSNELYE